MLLGIGVGGDHVIAKSSGVSRELPQTGQWQGHPLVNFWHSGDPGRARCTGADHSLSLHHHLLIADPALGSARGRTNRDYSTITLWWAPHDLVD
jgi:hypothetical protein